MSVARQEYPYRRRAAGPCSHHVAFETRDGTVACCYCDASWRNLAEWRAARRPFVERGASGAAQTSLDIDMKEG